MWDLREENGCHAWPSHRQTLAGCVGTAGILLFSGSRDKGSNVTIKLTGTRRSTLDNSCQSKCNFCNRGREGLQSEEACCEEKAKDLETMAFQRIVAFTLGEKWLCHVREDLGHRVHVHRGMRAQVCDRVSKLLDDGPESTHDLNSSDLSLDTLELGQRSPLRFWRGAEPRALHRVRAG